MERAQLQWRMCTRSENMHRLPPGHELLDLGMGTDKELDGDDGIPSDQFA